VASRSTAPALQWRRVESLLDHDFNDESLPRAVAAGKGVEFQRLEFLGDRVLELSVAVGLLHADRSGNPQAAARLAQVVAKTTDNAGLAKVSMSSHLSGLLGFRASRKRKGDMVEAAAGALFIDGGWAPLDRFAVATGMVPEPPLRRDLPPDSAIDTVPDELLAAVEDTTTEGGAALARARVMGGMVVDAAHAWWAYRTMPGRDEGVLAPMVHERTSNNRLAAAANRHQLPESHGRAENRLRAWVGVVTVEYGRAAGLALTSRLFNLGLPEPGV
jgi:hypothetical protein